MDGEGVFREHFSAEDVFLEDAFNEGGASVFVPDAIGLDDEDGAVGADAEAVAAGAEEACGGSVEFEFTDAFFEVGPGGFAFGGGDAIGSGAKQQMAAHLGDLVGGGLLLGEGSGGRLGHGEDSGKAGGGVADGGIPDIFSGLVKGF